MNNYISFSRTEPVPRRNAFNTQSDIVDVSKFPNLTRGHKSANQTVHLPG